MKMTTAKSLVRAGEQLGLDVRLRRSHLCNDVPVTAVVVNSAVDLAAACAAAATTLPFAMMNGFVKEVSDLKSDTLGRGLVVY